MSGAAIALLSVGLASELAGMLMIGWRDLSPLWKRLRRWLWQRPQILWYRFFRLIGRPRHPRVISASAAMSVGGSAHTSGVVGVRAGASSEEKLEFLLRRDEKTQRRLNKHERRLSTLERESPKRLDELRQTMESHVAKSLAEDHRFHLATRRVGFVLLVVGTGCLTVASFV